MITNHFGQWATIAWNVQLDKVVALAISIMDTLVLVFSCKSIREKPLFWILETISVADPYLINLERMPCIVPIDS